MKWLINFYVVKFSFKLCYAKNKNKQKFFKYKVILTLSLPSLIIAKQFQSIKKKISFLILKVFVLFSLLQISNIFNYLTTNFFKLWICKNYALSTKF